MSRDTERVMRAFDEYLKAHGNQISDNQSLNQLARQFTEEYNDLLQDHEPESAEDYLALSNEAPSKSAALRYAKKALSLEPDNLDAASAVAQLAAQDDVALLDKLSALIEKGNRQMERENHFKESMGDFWMVLETRPYMRLRYDYMQTLIRCGMYRQAILEGRQLMELCKEDNLGVRFDLIHLYAHLDDLEPALALKDSHPANKDDGQFLMALAALYFKRGALDESLACLKKLCAVNRDAKRFLQLVHKEDEDSLFESTDDMGYRPYTIEELGYEYFTYLYLFENIQPFFDWAYRKLRNYKVK